MSALEALVLGLVQGLTEFLPVSSSGHLALGRALLGFEAGGGAFFEVLVHVATALSILTVYRRDFAALARGAPAFLAPWKLGARYREDSSVRLLVWIGLSAVPAAAVGLAFEDDIESLFDRPRIVGALLIATGLWLLCVRFFPRRDGELGLRIALVMGCAQAFAILPGISRSGATIGAGLLAGGARDGVGRFAFLMALVPIFGAALLQLRDVGAGPATPLLPATLGFLAAYLSGLFALRLLLVFVARGGLWVFGPYCLAVGGTAVLVG